MNEQNTCSDCKRCHMLENADELPICTARIVEYDRGYGDWTYGSAYPMVDPNTLACRYFEPKD